MMVTVLRATMRGVLRAAVCAARAPPTLAYVSASVSVSLRSAQPLCPDTATDRQLHKSPDSPADDGSADGGGRVDVVVGVDVHDEHSASRLGPPHRTASARDSAGGGNHQQH